MQRPTLLERAQRLPIGEYIRHQYVVEATKGLLGFDGADGEHVRDTVGRRLGGLVDA